MSRSATTVATPTHHADTRENQLRSTSDGRLPDRDREREERRAQRSAARGRRSPDTPAPVRDRGPGSAWAQPVAPDRVGPTSVPPEPVTAERVTPHTDAPVHGGWSELIEPPPARGRSGRQTVTITGRGAEAYATRRGTRASSAQRHQSIRRHEREGFRPDRVAMWAVMLGVMLMLAAAASSHAAVLAHHVPIR